MQAEAPVVGITAQAAFELPVPPPMEPGAVLFPGPAVQYAGWWRRVGGWVIDALIIGVGTNVAAAVIGGTGSSAIIIVGLVAITVGYVSYYVMLNANGQQTIGRRVLGTRIVQENGDDLGYGLSALRLLASLLSVFTAFLGLLWPLWDPKHQTFHDKIALTIVIKT